MIEKPCRARWEPSDKRRVSINALIPPNLILNGLSLVSGNFSWFVWLLRLIRPGSESELVDIGLKGIVNSPDEFAIVIKSENPKWAKVIEDSGIKPD